MGKGTKIYLVGFDTKDTDAPYGIYYHNHNVQNGEQSKPSLRMTFKTITLAQRELRLFSQTLPPNTFKLSKYDLVQDIEGMNHVWQIIKHR